MNDSAPGIDRSAVQQAQQAISDALQEQHPQHAVETLLSLHPADRAEVFTDLHRGEREQILAHLDIPATADLLEELEDQLASRAAATLTNERLADVLDEMEPDEAADVLGDLPPERASKALAEMEEAEDVLPLLSHGDETAGGLMTTSYIALRPDRTTAEAIDYLREIGPEEETPYYLYVIDTSRHLVGIVSLRTLVVSKPDTIIADIMDPDTYHATTSMDQEDAARLMVRYDLAALPVVDHEGVLAGVITYDDLVDVLEDEATEDIYRLANVSDADLTIDSPVGLSIRRRLPWLYVNAFTAFFASWVIAHFEGLIAQVAVLAAFQSVVAGLGGNTATQSLAIIVRAIALGEISPGESARTVFKEGLTGLLQGLAVGLAAGIGVYLWQGNAYMGLILALALVGNMLLAGLAGAFVPLGLRALNLDPALASSVLVTAITDSVGFALFLGLASLFLPHLT